MVPSVGYDVMERGKPFWKRMFTNGTLCAGKSIRLHQLHCMMLQLNRFAVQDAVSSIGYNGGRSRDEGNEEYTRCRLSNSR